MDVHMRRRAAIRRLIDEEFGGVQARFAAAIGKKPAYLYQILTDSIHSKQIGEAMAREIERKLDLREGLLDEHAPQPKADKKHRESESQPMGAEDKASMPHGVPVLTTEALRGGRKGRAIASEQQVYVKKQPAEGAFGYDIADFSMDPEFLPGDTVLVDPGAAPNGGDFVLARVNGEVIVRRYVLDNPGYMLGAVSTAFAPIFSDRSRIEILGVITEHHRDLEVRRKRTN